MTSPAQATDSAAAVDLKAYRNTLGCFATGVTVITTRDPQGEPVGLTVNSFNSVSLEPPLILWSLALDSQSLQAFQMQVPFGVNILSADQEEISSRFASKQQQKFEGVLTREGPAGVPLLEGCTAWLVCYQEYRYYGGDHVIFIGRVVHFERTERRPLLFCDGQYMVAAPLPSDPVG